MKSTIRRVSVAFLTLVAVGCGGSPPAPVTQNQGSSPHRRFEVKTRDVFDHSIGGGKYGLGVDKDAVKAAPLHPESDLDDDCRDGWEPYAVERVTESIPGELGTTIERVFVRYYLKREL